MALPSAQDHVSLPRVLDACANPNNLVAIQVPFNIFEREAIVPNALGLASPEKTVADLAEVSKKSAAIHSLSVSSLNYAYTAKF